MKILNGVKNMAVVGVFILVTAFVAGCSSGPSLEQLAELESLKKEISSLERDLNAAKDERSRLDKEIAEKNKRLQECAKLKQETQANLEKIKK
ncbi:MAG: hypothetical protein Q8N03_01975 [Ignavibacteria bacterium]|jgi:outer membrane murein-binding lipoprotein Lpp|nr:hypothetical protein [Ignavibacteria bacterium]